MGTPTCEEFEGGFRFRTKSFDLAEEREGEAVGVPGERLDVPTQAQFCLPELAAREGQDVEVRGAQLPVELLQEPEVRLRVLAVTRHVYNQRRLSGERQTAAAPLNHSPATNTTTADDTRKLHTSLRGFTASFADDVDILFLGTSPGKPSSLWRL